MAALGFPEKTAECFARPRGFAEQFQKDFPIAIGQGGPRFLQETNLLFGNDPGLPNSNFRVADLVNNDRGIGERPRKADAGFLIGCAR